MKRERIEYLDIVRGICILYMIAGHIGFQSEAFDHYIHAFHMPIFFVLSGYFYNSSKLTFFEFIKKNTKKLLLPYLFWACVFLVIDNYTCLGNYGGIKKGLYSIFLYNNYNLPIAGALWFLSSFYFSNLIFFVLEKRIKNRKGLFLSSIGLSMIGIYLKSAFDIDLIWSLNSSLVGVGLIYIGYLIKIKDWLSKLYIKNIFLLILVAIFHFLSIKYTNYVNMRISSYPFCVLFLLNIIISLMVYISISKRIVAIQELNVIKKILIMIGKESMISLCLNQFVIRLVNRILIWNFSYRNAISCLISISIITILIFVLRNSKIKFLFGK